MGRVSIEHPEPRNAVLSPIGTPVMLRKMRAWSWCGWLLVSCTTLVRAATPAGPPDIGAPVDTRYAEQAATLAGRRLDFDSIFSRLLTDVLAETATNAHVRLDDRVRSVFGGLWIWASKTGRPSIQGRQDWALHFIGGGAFEGYFDAGTSAGLIKERSDARDPHNRYDRDDLAATMLGARWVSLATTNDATAARRWVQSWANRERTIERSLPTLRLGRLPQGKEASVESFAEVWRFVEEGLTMSAGGHESHE